MKWRQAIYLKRNSEIFLGIQKMVVKMIHDLRKRMEAQTEKIQEILNKELDDIKNNQLNNGIMKMKNAPEGIGE